MVSVFDGSGGPLGRRSEMFPSSTTTQTPVWSADLISECWQVQQARSLESSTFADSALKRVEWLGGLVSVSARDRQEGEGMGGTVYDGVSLAQLTGKVEESKSKQVWAALATLERDSTFVL